MMTSAPENPLTPNDRTELENLVNVLELSDGTTIVFAVAPDSSPKHPVVEELKGLLSDCDEEFAVQNFFYSDSSLHPFLNGLQPLPEVTRRVVMAFGIDRLPLPRQVRELRQLNLGREMLFSRNLVLVFWLNRGEYLEVFRDRAPDFWDWREQVVTFETRPRLELLLYPYLEWLIAENSSLKMGGVMQVQRQVDLFLDRIYVSLRGERQVEVASRSKGEMELAAQRSPGKSLGKSLSQSFADELEPIVPDVVPDFGSPDLGSTKTVTEKVDLAQAIRNQQYSVILGDPGAGKTTLLRYLALHFATARRDEAQTVLAGEEREDLGQTRLPIFFRIADYAEKLATQPDLKLDEFLQQFYRQWETQLTAASTEFSAEEVAQLLGEKLQSGQCIVLLDGLDEVFDRSSRKQIVDGIEAFVSAYAGNKFVITSRIAGYQEVNLSQRFGHFTITEMERQQVERFLHRWCLAVEQAQQSDAAPERQKRNAEEEVRGLLDAIDSNEGVQRLTGNPLLLTILALIHRNGSRLPHRRVELYALAVKTLTEDWQLGKKLPDGEKVLLKETEVVDLLAPLAYWMHEEKPSGLVSQEEVEAKLAEKLAELNDEEPDSPSVRQAVEAFLRRVRETTGLFVERAPGFYGFMHLTFEEYFAARYIADNDSEDMLALIRRHQEDARWEEPILLALGYYNLYSTRQFQKLLEKLFKKLFDWSDLLKTKYFLHILSFLFSSKNNSFIFKIFFIPIVASVFIFFFFRQKHKKYFFAHPSDLYLKIVSDIEINGKVYKKILESLSVFYCYCSLLSISKLKEKYLEKADKSITKTITTKDVSDLILNTNNKKLIDDFKNIFQDLEYLSINKTKKSKILEFLKFNSASIYLYLYFNHGFVNTSDPVNRLSSYINEDCEFPLMIYFQSGIICYEKHNYQQAICYFQKSITFYKKYNKSESLIATLWSFTSHCYRELEEYQEALSYEMKDLEIRQQLNDDPQIADSYCVLGRIYQDWGKYDRALEYYQQSHDLYQKLAQEKDVANQLSWLASCYRDLEDYPTGIEYYQQSRDLYQQLELNQSTARRYRQIGNTQRLMAKNTPNSSLLTQAEQNIQHAIQLDTTGDYTSNLAYDAIVLALICAEFLHHLPADSPEYPQRIAQFETNYRQGFDSLTQLGKTVSRAEEALDIARAYLEVPALHNPDTALTLAREALQTFQDFNRRKLQAKALKLLGEIHRHIGDEETARTFFTDSANLYRELDLPAKVAEVLREAERAEGAGEAGEAGEAE